MKSDSIEWWPAPAKLNLFLHITGQRSDGYHELQTVFQLLDYGDQIRFSVNKNGFIQRSNRIENLASEQDIVVKAARLLAAECACSLGVKIALRKHIPMGAGLGGGSSDAATALVALNRLWQLGLDQQQLMSLGLQLGADVPLFIAGHSAWAESVGDKLEALDLPDCHYLVVRPPLNVSTAEMYSDPNLTRDHEIITIRDYFLWSQQDGDGDGNGDGNGKLGNDFEPLLRRRYPEIGEALDWLTQQSGVKARVSGTGSCLFVAKQDESALRAIAANLPKRWRGFVARGVNESPLLAL